jgi:acetyl esterase/lipase
MMSVSKKVTIQKYVINGMNAEIIAPKQIQSPRIIIYFHGGGNLYCSINTHRGLASLIAEQTQIPVLIIDYRRAPEHIFPAALEDALSSYDWLLNQKAYAPTDIFFGGDSAGGGLAITTMLKLKELNKPLPKAAFLISPWLDLSLSGESMKSKIDLDVVLTPNELSFWAGKYIAGENPKNPLISPLFGNLIDLPPIFIQVGSSELLYSDSIRFYDALNAVNNGGNLIIWPDLIHAFPLFAAIKFIGKFLPESNEAIGKIKVFLEKL